MTTTPREIFDAYVRETRRQHLAGVKSEDLGHLLRCVPSVAGAEGWVTFADLPAGREDRIIEEQVAHFAGLGCDFEWKVYGLDRPVDLRARLERRGFIAGDLEIFMAFPLERRLAFAARAPGVEIRRIVDEAGVREQVRIQEALHGGSFAWWGDMMLGQMREAPESIQLYGAYADGRAVGGGRIDFPAGTEFAGIHGGSLLPEWRGRGIYSMLLSVRAEAARARGYRFLMADSAPMSRPILERKGFISVCETRPMRLAKPNRL